MKNRTKVAFGVTSLAGLYLLAIKPSNRKGKGFENFKQVLYAHRGLFDNNSNAPENSMYAFENAIDHGFGMEIDVQLTKDKMPVVFHDFTLKRIARDKDNMPVEGKVSDYTYAELQQFHLLDSDQTIPSFEDFLNLVKGQVPLIIEYKIENKDIKAEVCKIANTLLKDYKGEYCIESFNPFGVLWYKIHRPDIIRGQLSDNFHKDKNVKDNPITFGCQHLLFNWITKPDFIAYNHKAEKNLSRRICHVLYKNEAVAWTIKDEEQLAKARKHFDMFIFDSFVPQENH